MQGYTDDQVILTEAKFAHYVGIAPNTAKAYRESGRIVPDRFLLGRKRHAYSLTYAKRYLADAGGVPPDEE